MSLKLKFCMKSIFIDNILICSNHMSETVRNGLSDPYTSQFLNNALQNVFRNLGNSNQYYKKK